MTFGARLKQLRKENGLEAKFVAKKLNIAKSTYSGYENDKTRPSFELLNNLANLFNVSIDYLLCRSDYRGIMTESNSHITDDLSQEEIEQLIKYAAFLKSQRKSNT